MKGALLLSLENYIKMSTRHSITLDVLYKKMVELQHDIGQIKRSLVEDPELRKDFIMRMENIELEKSIPVEDFGKRYGLP